MVSQWLWPAVRRVPLDVFVDFAVVGGSTIVVAIVAIVAVAVGTTHC